MFYKILAKLTTLLVLAQANKQHSPKWSDWNFMAYLSIYVTIDDFQGIKQCVGSILNEKWLLSAAHCANIDSPNSGLGGKGGNKRIDIYVIIGRKIIKYGQKSSTTATPFCHEEYNQKFDNDICVLRLSQKINFRKTKTRTVMLADDLSKLPVGSICHTAGWGEANAFKIKTTMGTGKLWATDQRMEDNDICEEIFSKVFLADYQKDKHICTSSGGSWNSNNHEPDKGDSGGPLMCSGQLYGIVSFGPTRVMKIILPVGLNGVAYTNVQNYLGWINEKIINNNGDLRTYKTGPGFSGSRKCTHSLILPIFLSSQLLPRFV